MHQLRRALSFQARQFSAAAAFKRGSPASGMACSHCVSTGRSHAHRPIRRLSDASLPTPQLLRSADGHARELLASRRLHFPPSNDLFYLVIETTADQSNRADPKQPDRSPVRAHPRRIRSTRAAPLAWSPGGGLRTILFARQRPGLGPTPCSRLNRHSQNWYPIRNNSPNLRCHRVMCPLAISSAPEPCARNRIARTNHRGRIMG